MKTTLATNNGLIAPEASLFNFADAVDVELAFGAGLISKNEYNDLLDLMYDE